MNPRHFRSVGLVEGIEIIHQFEFTDPSGERFRVRVFEDLSHAETSLTKFGAHVFQLVARDRRRVWRRLRLPECRGAWKSEAFRLAMDLVGRLVHASTDDASESADPSAADSVAMN